MAINLADLTKQWAAAGSSGNGLYFAPGKYEARYLGTQVNESKNVKTKGQVFMVNKFEILRSEKLFDNEPSPVGALPSVVWKCDEFRASAISAFVSELTDTPVKDLTQEQTNQMVEGLFVGTRFNIVANNVLSPEGKVRFTAYVWKRLDITDEDMAYNKR